MIKKITKSPPTIKHKPKILTKLSSSLTNKTVALKFTTKKKELVNKKKIKENKIQQGIKSINFIKDFNNS